MALEIRHVFVVVYGVVPDGIIFFSRRMEDGRILMSESWKVYTILLGVERLFVSVTVLLSVSCRMWVHEQWRLTFQSYSHTAETSHPQPP